MILKSFLSGCLFFGHGVRVHARDADQQVVRRCLDCGHDLPVLRSAVVKGPQFQQEPIPGQPITKVLYPERAGKVAEFPGRSER